MQGLAYTRNKMYWQKVIGLHVLFSLCFYIYKLNVDWSEGLMKYEKAENILPQHVVEIIQKYMDGGYIYIPRKNENKKSWGSNTDTKKYLNVRNKNIYNKYCTGISVKDLAEQYFLTENSIRRIIANQKSYG